MAAYLSGFSTINSELISEESSEVKTIINLLLRHLFNGKQWTNEEAEELRVHFKNAAKIVYPFFIFILPGGLFLLPFVTYWLHKPKG